MYDVVIVGYGPTGMLAAISAGPRRASRRGDRAARRRSTTCRASASSMTTCCACFKQVGCIEAIIAGDAFPAGLRDGQERAHPAVERRIRADRRTHGAGRNSSRSISRPSRRNSTRSPRSVPSVTIFPGETVTALAQDADGVSVTAANQDGKTRQVAGRYLIGADGGNSFVLRDAGDHLRKSRLRPELARHRRRGEKRPARPSGDAAVLRAGTARRHALHGAASSPLVVHDLPGRTAGRCGPAGPRACGNGSIGPRAPRPTNSS